ncbi:MAG: Hpt domain-containing protein [Terriglobales bacterium]|nr:Hpt domain-containing protein [Terriglobales bacterium]
MQFGLQLGLQLKNSPVFAEESWVFPCLFSCRISWRCSTEASVTQENLPAPGRGAWNKAETIESLGGDEELLRELVEIFVDQSPKLLNKLRDAISSFDAEGVMRAAHSIKGELSCLGALAAAKTAQKLETMGGKKEMAGASEMFTSLERELKALKLSLADFTQS